MASTATAATGCSLRPCQRAAAVGAFFGAKANCSASCVPQLETHSMQAVHSTEQICTRRATGSCIGQALAHLPHSTQASASQRIVTGLNSDTTDCSAP